MIKVGDVVEVSYKVGIRGIVTSLVGAFAEVKHFPASEGLSRRYSDFHEIIHLNKISDYKIICGN